MASEQLVVFQLGNEEYAVAIDKVKEIIRYKEATKLPSTPPYMEGIINLRGKVIPVVDLAKRFGLERELTEGKQAVIIEAAGQEVGVVVDGVTEVLRIDDSAIEPAQSVAYGAEFLRSIGKVGERLLIILDLDKVFSDVEIAIMREVG